VATIIYDATVAFCGRFVDRRSRMVDQMVQAARSGRQNVAEGSRASATSSQTELRLVNVARASLDELLLDYEDFLRQRGKRLWAKDDPEARAVRAVGSSTDQGDRSDRTDPVGGSAAAYAQWLTSPDPEVVANTVISLIHQANYLLDRQLAGLEQQFVHGGGYSERLAAARIAERAKRQNMGWDKADGSDRTDQTDRSQKAHAAPACPFCGRPMALRTARQGARPGAQFWGCSAYPECRGTRQQ
jgi:four helix bundle suffix protein